MNSGSKLDLVIKSNIFPLIFKNNREQLKYKFRINRNYHELSIPVFEKIILFLFNSKLLFKLIFYQIFMHEFKGMI